MIQIPKPFKGETVKRQHACTSCNETSGIQIGEVDYWDIKRSKIVHCTACGLSQLDPMLNKEETAKGCLAYYIEESLRTPNKEEQKNYLRNYRRGYLFASNLKSRNIEPKRIMETGPGSGYFCQGIVAVFPNSEITVMDVNPEVLEFNKENHGYHTIQADLETLLSEYEAEFDLIIARDILEHVIDISTVLQNFRSYLKSTGHLHFITPNGHEDVWKHYLTFSEKKTASELLINHVNYFDGKGLHSLLNKYSFSKVEYYTYKLKHARRGKGWQIKEKLMADVSTKKESDYYINSKIDEIKHIKMDKESVLDKWYLNSKWSFLTYFVSWFHHENLIKVNPSYNIGHEIYGLFRVSG